MNMNFSQAFELNELYVEGYSFTNICHWEGGTKTPSVYHDIYNSMGHQMYLTVHYDIHVS